MRMLMIVGCLVVVPPVVWAETYQVTPTQMDARELMNELQRAVPSIGVCADTWGTIACTGEITEADRIALDAVVTAHDPDIRAKREARRKAEEEEQEIPLGEFGAGAAGALAVLAGRGFVVRVRKKKAPPA